MKQEEFNQQFRDWSKSLSLKIIKVTSEIKYTDALSIIRRQLIRSSTSVAANFRAICRARSEKEDLQNFVSLWKKRMKHFSG